MNYLGDEVLFHEQTVGALHSALIDVFLLGLQELQRWVHRSRRNLNRRFSLFEQLPTFEYFERLLRDEAVADFLSHQDHRQILQALFESFDIFDFTFEFSVILLRILVNLRIVVSIHHENEREVFDVEGG